MNTNVQKLLDALRSGEFTQAQGQLRRGDGHCCLGVACEVYKRETGNGTWTHLDDEPRFVASDHADDWSAHLLPPTVKEWYGFSSEAGRFEDAVAYFTCLTDLNDCGGLSFEDIADVIESAPGGLFES